MAKPTFTVGECRKSAQEFRELAEREPRPRVRETLLEIARLWDSVAATLERQQKRDGDEN
jgi:hypothetical protein